MKVNIGPYTNYIGPYQIAEKIFFWVKHTGVYTDEPAIYSRWDYRACDKLGDWLDTSFVNKFCTWVESKKKRKIEVRIDSHDTWSMDHTLAFIIHPMLVQLKEKNHGYFSSDPEDVPSIGEGQVTKDLMNDTFSIDRYKWIMDEMIWTFKTLKSDDDMLFYSEDGVWDFKGLRAHDDRIQNGLRLFGKYYRALWD